MLNLFETSVVNLSTGKILVGIFKATSGAQRNYRLGSTEKTIGTQTFESNRVFRM